MKRGQVSGYTRWWQQVIKGQYIRALLFSPEYLIRSSSKDMASKIWDFCLGEYDRVYMAKKQFNGISSIEKNIANPEMSSWASKYRILNEGKFFYCRPLSGHSYSGLVFTAVKSYENFMGFDTWLIGVQQ